MINENENKIVIFLFGAVAMMVFFLAIELLRPADRGVSISMGEPRLTSIEHLARAEELAAKRL